MTGLLAVGCLEGGALENAEEHLAAAGTGNGAACDAIPIFEERCAGGICHSMKDDGSAPGGGTDLLSPGVEERILSQAALTYGDVDDPENCPDTPELLIDPANPEGSLLLTKLLGTHSCGAAMPVPNPPTSLSEGDIECVRSWINGIVTNQSGGEGTGGASGTGGAGTGGVGTGGVGTGGAMTGGTDPGTGGAGSGGAGTGGMATGGAGTGGAGTGGMGTGGMGTVSMPGDCSSTPECQMKYAGATDCSNGMGGICLCGADPCVGP